MVGRQDGVTRSRENRGGLAARRATPLQGDARRAAGDLHAARRRRVPLPGRTGGGRELPAGPAGRVAAGTGRPVRRGARPRPTGDRRPPLRRVGAGPARRRDPAAPTARGAATPPRGRGIGEGRPDALRGAPRGPARALPPPPRGRHLRRGAPPRRRWPLRRGGEQDPAGTLDRRGDPARRSDPGPLRGAAPPRTPRTGGAPSLAAADGYSLARRGGPGLPRPRVGPVP